MIIKRSFFLVVFAYLFLFALAQIPIWAFEYLPLQDYPNHLARMHIIINIHENLYLQKYYNVAFSILPNLAMEIFVPALNNFLPLQIAGKLMIVIILLSISSGTLFLNYALFKRISVLSFLPFMLLFNEAFIKGFINFLFGVGLAMWCIGFWILMRNTKPCFKIALFSILSSLILISHLFAFGFYAVIISTYEIGIFLKKKNIAFNQLAINYCQFILPLILYHFSPTSSSKANIEYSSIITKLFVYPFTLFSHYSWKLNLLTVISLLVIIGVGFYLKKIKFDKSMILPIIVLTIIYLIIPRTLSSGSNVDWRLLIPLTLIIISSINLSTNSNKIINICLSSLLLLIFLLHLSTITVKWASMQNEYQEISHTLEKINEGSRIFTARGYYSDEDYRKNTIAFMHFPTYAIIWKSAFVPSLFAFETQQPVRFNKDYIDIVNHTSSPVYNPTQEIDWDTVIKQYDYVLLARKELIEKIPLSSLSAIYQGKNNTLYKIKAQ